MSKRKYNELTEVLSRMQLAISQGQKEVPISTEFVAALVEDHLDLQDEYRELELAFQEVEGENEELVRQLSGDDDGEVFA